LAVSNLVELQVKYKEKHDHQHRDIKYKPGDLVLYLKHDSKVHDMKKLNPKWKGPYKVIRHTRKLTVKLLSLGLSGRSLIEFDAHVSQLKPYIRPDCELSTVVSIDSNQSKLESVSSYLISNPSLPSTPIHNPSMILSPVSSRPYSYNSLSSPSIETSPILSPSEPRDASIEILDSPQSNISLDGSSDSENRPLRKGTRIRKPVNRFQAEIPVQKTKIKKIRKK